MGSSLKRDALRSVLPIENVCKTYPVGQKIKFFKGKLSRLKLTPRIIEYLGIASTQKLIFGYPEHEAIKYFYQI